MAEGAGAAGPPEKAVTPTPAVAGPSIDSKTGILTLGGKQYHVDILSGGQTHRLNEAALKGKDHAAIALRIHEMMEASGVTFPPPFKTVFSKNQTFTIYPEGGGEKTFQVEDQNASKYQSSIDAVFQAINLGASAPASPDNTSSRVAHQTSSPPVTPGTDQRLITLPDDEETKLQREMVDLEGKLLRAEEEGKALKREKDGILGGDLARQIAESEAEMQATQAEMEAIRKQIDEIQLRELNEQIQSVDSQIVPNDLPSLQRGLNTYYGLNHAVSQNIREIESSNGPTDQYEGVRRQILGKMDEVTGHILVLQDQNQHAKAQIEAKYQPVMEAHTQSLALIDQAKNKGEISKDGMKQLFVVSKPLFEALKSNPQDAVSALLLANVLHRGGLLLADPKEKQKVLNDAKELYSAGLRHARSNDFLLLPGIKDRAMIEGRRDLCERHVYALLGPRVLQDPQHVLQAPPPVRAIEAAPIGEHVVEAEESFTGQLKDAAVRVSEVVVGDLPDAYKGQTSLGRFGDRLFFMLDSLFSPDI